MKPYVLWLLSQIPLLGSSRLLKESLWKSIDSPVTEISRDRFAKLYNSRPPSYCSRAGLLTTAGFRRFRFVGAATS
jgi:hypothetical protein